MGFSPIRSKRCQGNYNMGKCQIGYGYHAEDEYMIVGTKEGLQHLIEHCKTALAKGHSTFEDNCELEGIKLVEEDYFKEEKESFLSKTYGILIIVIVISSLIVGFVTIIHWLFSL